MLISAFGIVCLGYIIYVLLIGPPVYGTNDDVGISMILSGVWASVAPSGYSLYVNYLLGSQLAKLYKMAPGITWYPFFLLGSQFVSLVLLLFSVFRNRYNFWSILFGSLLVFITLMPGMWYLQFTYVSALCSISGLILFFSTLTQPPLKSKAKWTLLLCAASMIFLGSLIRYHSVLLIAAFFTPYALVKSVIWIKRGTHNKRLTFITGSCWVLFLAAGVSFIRTADVNHYKKNEIWARWFDLNIAKSEFLDYKFLNYSEKAAQKYKDVGWSENDVKLIKTWQYIDRKTFSVEKFMEVYASLSSWRGIDNLKTTLDPDYLQHFSLIWMDIQDFLFRNSFIPWLALAIIVFTFHSWVTRLTILTIILSFIAISLYLVFGLERSPFRVMIGLWIGFLWFLLFIKSNDKENDRKFQLIYFMKFGVLFLILIPGLYRFYIDISKAQERTTLAIKNQKDLTENINLWSTTLPEDALLYMVGSSFEYEFHLPLKPLTYWTTIPNVISAGSNNQSLHQIQMLEKLGLAPNFYENLIKRENSFVLLRQKPYDSRVEMGYLRKYYAEHHNVFFDLKPVPGTERIAKMSFSAIDSAAVNEPILNYLVHENPSKPEN